MELKPYQQKVIRELEEFLGYLQKKGNPKDAFNSFWADKIGPYSPQVDGSFSGMKPYKNNIPGATHIAMKVPTAGGKTFIACNALHSINQHFNQGNPKAVVWLVPWSNLLQQTFDNLSNPNHPYREKLSSLFNGRVEAYQKDDLLQGANFNPSSVSEQLNIFVFNFSSLRINSRKKEDRKVYKDNGNLGSFREIIDESALLPGTDDSALINIIRSLNPVVIVDESHNAESDLSVEMLNNLNPSLVLDLTATPKSNSNIISFVNALALKKQNMVKLPVVVHNHNRKEEVISNALHLRRKLELHAIEEEKITGKYIRPIILFQAQSNIKGKNNTTFQKIKDKLINLKIPEEQIKIKVSGKDELKDVDLSAKDCPVRYIITVNALKEGWDCPNAYILASLADKSSPVEVEQILGRVLRQPYVTQHQNKLLNLSFVLTASNKFNDTLDNIVEGLQESGFSRDDYYAEEAPEEEKTDNEILEKDLFSNQAEEETKSDDEFETDQIDFDPEEEVSLESLEDKEPTGVHDLTENAVKDSDNFEEQVRNADSNDDSELVKQVMGKKPKKFEIVDKYREIWKELKLPQFYIKQEHDEKPENVLFDEAASYEKLLTKSDLIDKDFNLPGQDSNIQFEDIAAEIRTLDVRKETKSIVVNKINSRTKKILMENILAKPKASQVKDVTHLIVEKLGNMYPIPETDLYKYVSRIFNDLAPDQTREVINNDFNYSQKIKDKIKTLTMEYSREKFKQGLASKNIYTEKSFRLPEKITPIRTSTPIAKSLYENEGSMNNFERDMITNIQALPNIEFWHRNLERGKGFFINGYSGKHYPDFIICTKNKNIVLMETKGDDRDNEDSRGKNNLGKAWAEKAGSNYSYFMVFQNKDLEYSFTSQSIIEVLKKL